MTPIAMLKHGRRRVTDKTKNRNMEPGMVAHTCNPCCSGGTDQEDCSLLQNVIKIPISTNNLM
jgi:hypothetical protein